MRAFIITTFIGSFGLNESNKVISFILFPKDPAKAAEKFKTAEIEVIQEEKQLMQNLWKKGYKEFVYSVRKEDVHHAQPGNEAEEFVKNNLRKLAIDYKFVKDQTEFNQFLSKVNIELTKVKIKRAVERDRLIIQAIRATEEIDKAVNILIERLREWYGFHFPEMDRIISNHEIFAKIVAKYGDKQNIEDADLKQLKDKSMGIDLTEEDVKIIQEMAKQISDLYALREDLAKYIDTTLKEVAPNMRELAGPMLAAKLIAKGGGLYKLARMASSTLQLLGAEKSLFRYLHGKGKSPRFGLLFNHPLVQNASEELKGRVARVLASKLSIAAKMDYYSKENKSEQLKKDLNERIKGILNTKK